MARGYRWNKDVTCYHTTVAVRKVLSEGFLARRHLVGGVRNAAGGGSDAAISLTLDLRVARAIALGLRVGRLIARRELPLAKILIDGAMMAPEGLEMALKGFPWSEEDVALIDAGYAKFHAGMGTGHGLSFTSDKIELFESLPEVVKLRRVGTGQRPVFVDGWAPFEVLEEMSADLPAWHRLTWASFAWGNHWDIYKRLLAFSDVASRELYDPLFFATDLEALADVDPDDIGILEMKVDADWLCVGPRDAERMGYRPVRYADSQWAERCQANLDDEASGRTGWSSSWFGGPKPDNEEPWERGSAADTLSYLGAHMAEIRVYNPELIQDVTQRENLDDSLYEVGSLWDVKLSQEDESVVRQQIVDRPIAHPYFPPTTPHIAP